MQSEMLKHIPFEQALEIVKDEKAVWLPFALLSEGGRAKVRDFADSFYDGKFYDVIAVFYHCEQSSEDLLIGHNHSVEFKRVEGNRLVIDNLELEASDFDWMVNH